jgi:HEAT repeat protein
MNKSFWRVALMACSAVLLAACGNKETQQALDKSSDLVKQKQYSGANDVLVLALQAREAKIRAAAGNPADEAAAEALKKKVLADSEILKMERAQVPLYLQWDRADLASAVYGDVLTGDPDDTTVFTLQQNPDKDIRKRAVQVLGLVADPGSPNLAKIVSALVASTKDSDQDVRRAAVAALGAIKDPSVVEPLIGELKDSYWFARSEAADALGAKNDARAVGPLLDAVADSDKTVSTAAHDALVDLADAKAPAVKADDFAPRLNDADGRVSMTAAECMGLLKDARAVPVLLKLVTSDDPDVRLNAVKGLGEAGDRSALPTLRETLKDPDLNMRGWSIIGLGKLRDEDSLMDLEHIASDETEPQAIRDAASASVDEIKQSLPPVETP